MSAGIFVIQEDGTLKELREQPYDSEALLQRLLSRYPRLLGETGYQAGAVGGAEPLLLIKQEMGVPSTSDEGSRWSLDHLFVDRDGVPLLVEVKRSSDTRIRREVVGQMLDYAANAVVYWPVERIEASFRASVEADGGDAAEVLAAFLGSSMDPSAFWLRVKHNLQAGRVRLLFVADVIPRELQRIIEFLNEQMDPAEVLAVEVRQHVGEGIRSLVPRVVGRTAEAERRKGVQDTETRWDEDSFMAELEARPPVEANNARRILDWARGRELRIWWGTGVADGSFYPMLDTGDINQYTLAVRTGANAAYAQFQLAQMRPPFHTPDRRAELAQRLSSALGQQISPSAKYPSVRLDALGDRTEELLRVLDWVLSETASHHG